MLHQSSLGGAAPCSLPSKNRTLLTHAVAGSSVECLLCPVQSKFWPQLAMEQTGQASRAWIRQIWVLFNPLVYFILAVLGLWFCAWAFSSCGEGVYSLVARHGVLTVEASLFAEHGLQGAWASVSGTHGLNCPLAGGIFWDQGIEPVSPVLAGGSLTAGPLGKTPTWVWIPAVSAMQLRKCLYLCLSKPRFPHSWNWPPAP